MKNAVCHLDFFAISLNWQIKLLCTYLLCTTYVQILLCFFFSLSWQHRERESCYTVVHSPHACSSCRAKTGSWELALHSGFPTEWQAYYLSHCCCDLRSELEESWNRKVGPIPEPRYSCKTGVTTNVLTATLNACPLIVLRYIECTL